MKPTRSFDLMVQAYGWWVLRWRWPILVATLLMTALAASGGRFLRFSTDYRAFFSKENPQLRAFEALQDIYTKNDSILFVLAPLDGEVFTGPVLEAVEHLTQEAWKIPYAIRVDSITNFQHTYAKGDELIVSDLVSNAREKTPSALAEGKDVALSEPLLVHRLIPPTAHVTGVNVTLQLPGTDITEVPQAVARARQLADDMRVAYPEIKVYLTGVVMLNNAFVEAGMRDIQTLVPLMYVVMFLLILCLLRSVSGLCVTLLVIGLSAACAMGLAGWWGVRLTPPSAQAPTMIMTLAVADSIHILMTIFHEMQQGRRKHEAIVESLRVNVQPVLLTALITIIGFLSMNFSDAPPFRHLGNITAVGVLAAVAYTVLFLPALIGMLPVRVKQHTIPTRSFMDRFADFVVRWPRLLLWGWSPVVLGLALFIPQNELNGQFVNFFDARIPFRTDTDFVMRNLSGIYQIEYSLGAGESGGISSPAYLATLEEFAMWYRTQPGVVHVNSLSDTMKRLNKNLHGDNPALYRLPDDRQAAAQYLFLYEMSLPYGLDLNNQINIDKSATRMIVTFKNITAQELLDTAARSESWLREHAPASMFTHGTSAAVMFASVAMRNIQTMLNSSAMALFLIAGSLFVTLRSIKFGIISLLPNLVPDILAYGTWGLLVGQVHLGVAMVIGMTMGIVVDDTVHLLSKYLRYRREHGLNAEDAIRHTLSAVGTAMIGTAAILVTGFLVLSLSPFDLNAGMSKLSAITIVFALFADLFMLPALLMQLDSKKKASSLVIEENTHA